MTFTLLSIRCLHRMTNTFPIKDPKSTDLIATFFSTLTVYTGPQSEINRTSSNQAVCLKTANSLSSTAAFPPSGSNLHRHLHRYSLTHSPFPTGIIVRTTPNIKTSTQARKNLISKSTSRRNEANQLAFNAAVLRGSFGSLLHTTT